MGASSSGDYDWWVVQKTNFAVQRLILVAIGCFSNGLVIGWTSPYSLSIPTNIEFNLTEKDTSFFIIIHPVGRLSFTNPFKLHFYGLFPGMLLSSLVYFKISEYLGRKKSLIALTVPHLFSWIMVLSAQNKWWFYASRFLGGVGDCVLFCSVPTYIGEITTPTIRGYWGNFPVFILNLGMFSMTVVGTGITAIRDFYFTTYHSFPFGIFLKVWETS